MKSRFESTFNKKTNPKVGPGCYNLTQDILKPSYWQNAKGIGFQSEVKREIIPEGQEDFLKKTDLGPGCY